MSLGFYTSQLRCPKFPGGMDLPRDSKTLVATGTAALIHQGLHSQTGLQAWWHLLASQLTTVTRHPGCRKARHSEHGASSQQAVGPPDQPLKALPGLGLPLWMLVPQARLWA